MLFLALPPADMLPPAGHRARPGRSHGPHRPLRTARRAPRTLSRALVQKQARPRLPYKVAPTPPPPPPPRPEQPAPPQGPGTGRLGWHPPGKSVRAKSWPGVVGATRPESALSRWKNPNNIIYSTAMPQTPHPTWGAWSHRCSSACIYAYTPRLGT